MTVLKPKRTPNKPIDLSVVQDNINIIDKNETLATIIQDVLPLFVRANKLLILILLFLICSDILLLLYGIIDDNQRIVNSSVVISLIAATAAEISAIIITGMSKLK